MCKGLGQREHGASKSRHQIIIPLVGRGTMGVFCACFFCDQTTIPIIRASDTALILFNAHHTCNHVTGEAPEVTTVRGLSRGYPNASFP